MKNTSSILAAAFMLLVLNAGCTHFSLAQQQKIRVLVISGGHGFKHEPFYDVFNSIPSITYDTLVQPQANALIASPDVNKYDVLVFYDMFDSIAPA
jgi:uncharacterized protein